MMKRLFIIICLLPFHAWAQLNFAEEKFHEGSKLFINGNPQAALTSVNEGLKSEPSNVKLNTLKKILEEEKKKQDQQKKEQKEKEQKDKQQQQKEQQQKDQQKKDQEKKDQQKSEQEKKDQEKKEQEEKDKAEKDQQKKDDQKEKEKKELPKEVQDRLKEMKIDEEKARMLLEAMRNQEIQYLQQNKRKAEQRRDPGKPDW